MQYESFSYTPTGMAEQLTGATHDTLSWLWRYEYLTKEEYDELTNRLIVIAIPNRKGFGRRLLDRFFGNTEEENAWVFPIVEVGTHYSNASTSQTKNVTKPKLNVVEGDFGKDKTDE